MRLADASSELPHFRHGTGSVGGSLGDNWESGGANRPPSGLPLWTFLRRATVEAAGKFCSATPPAK